MKPIIDEINGPPDVDDGGEDDEFACVRITLAEASGTRYAADAELVDESDAAVADAVMQCIRGIAAMRGPGLQVELAKRMGEAW
ncbi:hypothetical protein BAY59_10900 [Prauserella coralliicola]|nr:hypothetical protein BAY59_10900 [Prauserella coralliicola]